jgi:hypothetical protein
MSDSITSVLISELEIQARASDTILTYPTGALSSVEGRQAIERLSVELAVSLESSPASWSVDTPTGNLRLRNHPSSDVEAAVRDLGRRSDGPAARRPI